MLQDCLTFLGSSVVISLVIYTTFIPKMIALRLDYKVALQWLLGLF